ncbi:MAG: hypothetical protein M3O46_01025 [Myxococcota bacterium]|nr:hypothetical protein [Myxococcota bacterium]
MNISYRNIVNVPSGQVPSLNYVTPRDSGRSYLFCKLSPTDPTCTAAGTRIQRQKMPLGGSLMAAELAMIKTWIQQRALQ